LKINEKHEIITRATEKDNVNSFVLGKLIKIVMYRDINFRFGEKQLYFCSGILSNLQNDKKRKPKNRLGLNIKDLVFERICNNDSI
jgi:hypothetical protein